MAKKKITKAKIKKPLSAKEIRNLESDLNAVELAIIKESFNRGDISRLEIQKNNLLEKLGRNN